MRKTLQPKDKSKSRPKPKMVYELRDDGKYHPVISVGYRINAVEWIKESR